LSEITVICEPLWHTMIAGAMRHESYIYDTINLLVFHLR